MGSMYNTTTFRQEFTGLLEGLRLIKESEYYFDGISVKWYSDAKSLVECVNNPESRKSNIDLWLQLAYLENSMNITGVHIPRDADLNVFQNLSDLHASTMRESLKHYLESIK